MCRPAYLYKLPICNDTRECRLQYVDKACTIHTWIQSCHIYAMKVHKSCYTHGTSVALNLWVPCTVSYPNTYLNEQYTYVRMCKYGVRFACEHCLLQIKKWTSTQVICIIHISKCLQTYHVCAFCTHVRMQYEVHLCILTLHWSSSYHK